MVEIEIRAKIENFATTKKNLARLGAKLKDLEKQVDKVFGREKDLDKNRMIIEGHFSARIRQKGDKIKTEFKEIRRTGAGHEFSLPVESMDDGVFLLSNLDFEEAFTLSKTRETFSLNGFEICLDQVDELGNFIEIEHYVQDGTKKDDAINECKDLLKKIAPTARIEPRKYGDLMQELLNSKKI